MASTKNLCGVGDGTHSPPCPTGPVFAAHCSCPQAQATFMGSGEHGDVFLEATAGHNNPSQGCEWLLIPTKKPGLGSLHPWWPET